MNSNFQQLKRKLAPYSRPTGKYPRVDNIQHCCPHCDEGFNPVEALYEHESKCLMKEFYDSNGKFMSDKCLRFLLV